MAPRRLSAAPPPPPLSMRVMGRTMQLGASPSRGGGGGVDGVGGLQLWLGRELESRGIDAVVYTRYVLSLLLHGDSAPDDDAHLFPPLPRKHPPPAPARRRPAKRPLAGRRRTASDGGCDGHDAEEMKKTAAVECLLSVSDEVRREGGVERGGGEEG